MTSIMRASKFIPKEYISQLGVSLIPGETDCFVHDGCLSGESTKQKLYITRKSDNTLLAYCHRCGMRGYVRDPNYVTSIHDTARLSPTGKASASLRTWVHDAGLTSVMTSISDTMKSSTVIVPINKWLRKKHVDPSYADADGLAVNYTRDGRFWTLVSPCYAPNLGSDSSLEDPLLTGIQVRYFVEDYEKWPDGYPKVRTFGHAGPHMFNPNDSPVLYIVEDRISGIRIAQAGGAALVLHGCYVPTAEDAHACACMFDRIVVWLDNDNPKVLETAEHIKRTFSMFTDDVFLITNLREPKNIEPGMLSAFVDVDLRGVATNSSSDNNED